MSNWRYRCPKGHCSWNTECSEGYYCVCCDSPFEELVDLKEPAPYHVADPEVTAV